MKKLDKKTKEALLSQVYTILGVLWFESQLITTVAVTTQGDGETKKQGRDVSFKEYLTDLRTSDSHTDFSQNPERAYIYYRGRTDALQWTKAYFGISIVALLVAVIVGYSNKSNTTEISHIFNLVHIGGWVISVISSITSLLSLYRASQFKTSSASELVGEMWGNVRQDYDGTGFVDMVVNQSLLDETLAKALIDAVTLPKQLQTGDILRRMFMEHFANVGVPYVRSKEGGSSSKPKPKSDRDAEQRFNLMESMIPFMGFKNIHPGKIRTDAYNAARAQIERGTIVPNEGENANKIILFPIPNEQQRLLQKGWKSYDGKPSGDPGNAA